MRINRVVFAFEQSGRIDDSSDRGYRDTTCNQASHAARDACLWIADPGFGESRRAQRLSGSNLWFRRLRACGAGRGRLSRAGAPETYQTTTHRERDWRQKSHRPCRWLLVLGASMFAVSTGVPNARHQDESEGSRTSGVSRSFAAWGRAAAGNCSTVARWPSHRRETSTTTPSGNSNAS